MIVESSSLVAFSAVQNLLAHCATAGDRGDTDGFLACFTEDAVMLHSGNTTHEQSLPHLLRGHAEIGRFRENLAATPTRRHQLSNSRVIASTSDAMQVESQVTVVSADIYSIRIIRIGLYVDDLVLRDGRWMISRREIIF